MRVGFGIGVVAGLVGSVGMAGTLAGQTPSADGVVVVLPAGQEAEDWRDGALGFVADSGLVIAAVVGGPTEYVVVAVPDTGDVRYEAVLLAHDVGSGLGLLSVPGVAFAGYRFALVGARVGQEVTSVARERGDSAGVAAARRVGLVSGTVQEVDTVAGGGRGLVRHTASRQGAHSVGGPLLNPCGEVVAVAVEPGADSLGAGAVAVPASGLAARFAMDGLSVLTADEACLSDQERRLAGQEAEIAAARARADSLEAAAQAEREAADAELVAVQAERERLEAEAQAERRRIAELERARDSLAQAGDSAASAAERARQATESQRRTLLQRIYIGAGVAGLAILLILWLGLRSSRRARRAAAEAGRESARAQEEARAARVDLAVHHERERAAGEVPDIVLEGEGDHPVTVRVPGRAIARADGAVLGRSPFGSQAVLDHPEVSRSHLRISARGGVVLVEDLGSTNGTTLDGVLVPPGVPTPLEDGVRLGAGGLSLKVTMQGAPRGERD